jgi:tetratricopeptide (TPR) repeat protein
VAIRDPHEAIEFAQKAVALIPKIGPFHNTLGVANFRAGNWKVSIAEMEKSIALKKAGDAPDWFFMAMAHWQIGDRDHARKYYSQAVEWMDKNQPRDEELRRFRAEAAELLGIKEPAATANPPKP